MDLSKMSKKLSATAVSSGGAMWMAWEVLQRVLAGDLDIKLGFVTAAILAVAAVAQTIVYTISQGRVDLGKEAAKIDFQRAIAEATEILSAADSKKKSQLPGTEAIPATSTADV